jgi:hypothetical protein
LTYRRGKDGKESNPHDNCLPSRHNIPLSSEAFALA